MREQPKPQTFTPRDLHETHEAIRTLAKSCLEARALAVETARAAAEAEIKRRRASALLEREFARLREITLYLATGEPRPEMVPRGGHAALRICTACEGNGCASCGGMGLVEAAGAKREETET